HTVRPRKRLPVEKFLERQKRFRHLFEPHRQEETIRQIQNRVDDYWRQYE
ncbi:MAG: pyruvate synthase, partial [Nitrospina sp.]|nr:pyruvate synthase [Nitrospina sp.]MBT6596401.1 pyruvate synthase [Nitrospina sp.]